MGFRRRYNRNNVTYAIYYSIIGARKEKTKKKGPRIILVTLKT